jgi:predicted RNA binding protein YcfA (HicA-like mRNA interferase family)
MPKLPRISSREAIRALKRLGFEEVRQTGSHLVLKRDTDDGVIGCVVPVHQELRVGTLSSYDRYYHRIYRFLVLGEYRSGNVSQPFNTHLNSKSRSSVCGLMWNNRSASRLEKP